MEDYTSPLRAAREEAGLSIRQMERATGVHRARLSTIERGLNKEEQRLFDRAIRLAKIERERRHV